MQSIPWESFYDTLYEINDASEIVSGPKRAIGKILMLYMNESCDFVTVRLIINFRKCYDGFNIPEEFHPIITVHGGVAHQSDGHVSDAEHALARLYQEDIKQ